MVLKGKRQLHKKTVRSMLHWSHFRFRQYLTFKVKEYPHVNLKIVTEEYTSKTCGCCGDIHQTLGGNKVFHCKSCGWTIDRDINGARNILLKYLTEVHPTLLLNHSSASSDEEKEGCLSTSSCSISASQEDVDVELYDIRSSKRSKTTC
jgi:transposase